MAEIALPVVVSNGVSSYLQSIKRFPVLDAEDEYMLAKRYQEYDDLGAAHKLVTSHLRLAARIAIAYRSYGLPIADLISEANIGLMMAVKKFNPDKGFRLSTYAMWWIKAELHDFILKSWSLVRIGTIAAQKKLFYNLGKIKAKLGLYDNAELDNASLAKISKTLGVDKRDICEMNARIAGDVSLNAPVSAQNAEGDGFEKQDFLADDAPSQELVLAESEEACLRKKLFTEAMQSLNEREREIIVARYLQETPATLEDLGARFGVSRERVRQIEGRAYDKICKFVKEQIASA